MNNDLISREALKEEVSKLILNWNDKTEYGQARISSYEFVLELIDNAPTVEAYTLSQVKELVEFNQKLIDELEERQQGKWEIRMIYYCPECGYYCGESGGDFCPNCGADMRGAE